MLLAFSRPCEIPAAWSVSTCSPEILEQLVAHLIGVFERLDVWLAGHDKGVTPRAENGSRDPGHANAGL